MQPPDPAAVSLSLGHTCVWHVRPDALGADEIASRCLPLLGDDEIERSRGYKSAAARHAHLLGRLVSRLALARHARVSPESLTFTANEFGKPFVATGAARRLRFNLTHTDGLIACAVSQAAAVGIDAEAIDNASRLPSIRDEFFSDDELRESHADAATDTSMRLLEVWVTKEAYLKGIGTGLLKSPQHVTIRFDRERRPKPIGTWALSLHLREKHLVAIAVDCGAHDAAQTGRPVSWWDATVLL